MTLPPGHYVARFGMPIVAPPPAGTAPAGHYSAVAGRLSGWQVTSIAHHGVRVRFTSATASDASIFAVVGGLATFVPAGQPLPTAGAEASPGTGSIVLTTWAADFPALRRSLPPNVPPPAKVIYGNVSASAFRTAMQSNVAEMPLPALEHFWGLTQTTNAPDRVALETHFLDQAALGRTAVFVTGRDPLGSAEPENPAASTPTQLDLRFVDSGGVDLSPVLHLRSMPQWAGPEWTGHPLAASVARFPVPVNIYAAFEVYNLSTRMFDRLPAGVSVELRDYDPVSFDDLEATARTDAHGMVHFSFPDLGSVADSDLYFNVLTAGRSHAGHTLPAEWATKGWRTADGRPGYYEDFSGSQLGDAAHPLVFRIGVDFHARLRYTQYEPTYNSAGRPGPPRLVGTRNAPPGVPVSLVSGRPRDFRRDRLRTDVHGEIHGVSFRPGAEDDVWWGVDFEIEDASRNLPRATATPPSPARDEDDPPSVATFDSRLPGPTHILYARHGRTSVGTHASPAPIVLRSGDYNTALFFLRTWREMSVFLWHMTGHSWPGVADLEFFFDTIGGNSYSWPVGEVNIDDTQLWERGTVVHELAHQLMWREANYTTWTIFTSVLNICGGLGLFHDLNENHNPEHALIEGWAAYVEFLFQRSSTYPFRQLEDGTDLYDVPNKGESVEGAFANALFEITSDFVMPAGSGRIRDVDSGNVDTTATWITNSGAQAAFQTLIWGPLRALNGASTKSTTAYVEAVRARNLPQWHQLRRRFANWNLASGPASVSSVTPAAGPATGGQPITLRGANFIEGSSVEIGGVPATSVVVTSHDTITAVAPVGNAGRRDVVVVNPPPDPQPTVRGARATLAGGYEYQ